MINFKINVHKHINVKRCTKIKNETKLYTYNKTVLNNQ